METQSPVQKNPQKSLSETAGWQPSDRLSRLRSDHQAAQAGLGAERALHYTDFFRHQARQHDSIQIKMAEALKYHLQKRSIAIYPDEYIVGSHTEHRIGAICHVEKTGGVMLEDLYKFESRATNPIQVDKKKRGALLRAMLYWTPRNLAMQAFALKEKVGYLVDQLNASYFVINEAGGIAHFLPDYATIIHTGTEAMRQACIDKMEAIRAAESVEPSDKQIHFLKARLIALDSIELFANRYRELAEQQNRSEIAEMLQQVPRRPARSLREALQMIWFFQILIQIESLDQGISLGRIDQYLYPLYQKELKQGQFDPDQFRDYFGAFCLKLSEVIPLFSQRVTRMFGGLPSGQALTLGGCQADGTDAANLLTFLMLDVLEQFKTRQPNWHARIAASSSPAYLKRVYGIIAQGGGSPALYNDAVIIPALRRQGFPAEQLFNYATVGCVEPALPGTSFTSSDAALFNVAMALELLLGEGKRLGAGPLARKRSPGSIRLKQLRSFTDFKRAVFDELAAQLSILKNALDKIELANARFHPTPLASVTVQGCLESATDLSRGGALFNASGIQAVGIADLANSMAAIQQLVYQKQKFSLTEIARACAANFKGQSNMRAHLLKIAKYGNDNQLADQLANDITREFQRLVSQYRNTRGGQWIAGAYSMTCHRAFGSHMAAMPSGRLKGQSLADGIAPSDGSDVLGPTASLNSSASLDHQVFANGVNLNIKFDAQTLQQKGGAQTLEALLGGYFDQGGMQVQVNVLDQAVLQDAMQNPEQHRNLLVRISGYCAYFVDLSPAMQRELLERSLQKT